MALDGASQRPGQERARITSTVLFGAVRPSPCSNFRGPKRVIDLVFPVLTWLVGLAVVWLLWQRESTAFFKRQPYT